MKTENISFTVTALLGTTALPIGDYLELKVGDIIVLDQLVDQSIPIRFGKQSCYLGRMGLFQTHKAVICDERIYP